jgi:septal ring factor EnvC (AmiA/AmiB activator)
VRLSEAVALGAALGALVAAAVLASAGPVTAAPPGAVGELDAVRQECIAAAHNVQERERATLALNHEIDLRGRDAEGRQRGLDETRTEQAHLLGTLATLARNPPDQPIFVPRGAIERSRGELLLKATLPALRAEAQALSGEIERIAELREQIAAKKDEQTSARQALEADRSHLAELIAHRVELTRHILPEEAGGDARTSALGREASDIGDLIKRADAATERRDKEVLVAARAAPPKEKAGALTAQTADPTRPRELHAFDPPGSLLVTPVVGTITRRFGAEGAPIEAGGASHGLSLAALPGAEAIAPFDGRVIYAGPFRDLGLILIIRHGTLYHTLLAGLQRVDFKADQWVLAGEPVGAMPDTSGGALYFEVRRGGHPVDPQPWLAPDPGNDQGREVGRNRPDEDQKVRE